MRGIFGRRPIRSPWRRSAPALGGLVLGLLATPGAAWSQAQTFAPAPTPAPDVRLAAPPSSRLYGGVEYLYWWVKDAPLSVPLISTGPVANKEGFLINSASTILYGAPFSPATGGNNAQSFPGFSGSRVTLGYWLDDLRSTALEASGFVLQSRTTTYTASSNSAGSPGIRIPVYDSVPYAPGGRCDMANPSVCLVGPTEDGLPVAIPNELYGSAVAINTLQLWGLDLSGVRKIYDGPNWDISAIAGLRYLGLDEGFSLTDNLNGIAGSAFNGQSGVETDSFKTSNHFYGAGLGLRGSYTLGSLVAEMTGRVALGVSHEALSVQGSYVDQGASFVASSGPYGVFAMPANEGQRSANKFAVVPEVQVKLGYNLTPNVRLTVGYSFLYDSNVIRPGDQIDRNVPKGQTFQQDGTSPSTTSPARLFRTTDFFVQGLSTGVSVAF